MENSKEVLSLGNVEFPLLPLGELHLWKVSTRTTPSVYEEYKRLLTEKELTKIQFFEFQQARETYVVSQAVLRRILSGYLGIAPSELKLGQRTKGKPYSIDDSSLYFNMSHSGELAVIAFSRDSEVGIDIEQIRSLPDLDEMISRNFTAGEIKFINSRSEEKKHRFFRFWTVKESYLKAIGEGMRLTPDSVEFSIEHDHIRQLSVKGIFEMEDWNFKEFTTAEDYVGTVTYSQDKTIIKQMEFK